MDPPKHCQSIEWSLHCSMLSFRLKGRGTPYVQNTVRTQIDLFNVQCCHSDSKADGPPPSQHCQNTELSLHCSMLSSRLIGRWTPPKTLSEHRVISSLFNVVIQTQRQMDPLCAKHCQSTEWSLHCSMFSFSLKGRGTPCVQNTVRTDWGVVHLPLSLNDNIEHWRDQSVFWQCFAHRVSLYLWGWMKTLNSEEITLCSDSVLHIGGPSAFESEWQHWTVKRSLCALTVFWGESTCLWVWMTTLNSEEITLCSDSVQSYLFTVQCCHPDS